MTQFAKLAGLLFCVACCAMGRADVQSAAEQHFVVTTNITTDSSKEVSWAHLLKIGTWWNPSHTWSGSAKNLSLTAEPGGGFDEALENGGFVRHMQVVSSDPGKVLRMSGLLGPLQEHALVGTMSIQLKEENGKTEITATYRVSGYFPGGLDKLAPIVDKVLTEQFQRLSQTIDGKNLPEKK